MVWSTDASVTNQWELSSQDDISRQEFLSAEIPHKATKPPSPDDKELECLSLNM
jgi:hypothetical protein